MLRTAAVLVAAIAARAEVHTSPMAGRWFPAEKPALEKALDESFRVSAKRAGDGPPRKKLLGLVAPHAAIQYSGAVAAGAYRLLAGSPNIIVLGFSHRRPLEGVVAPDLDGYRTPLGEVRVNHQVLEQLDFPRADEKGLCDHSLENQLPMIQRAAPSAMLVPLYVGALGQRALETAARKLAARLAQGDVIVASSDFTHYGESYNYTPFPNDANLPRRLLERVSEAFESIGSLEVGEFDRFLASTGDTICGRDPIRLLMATLAALKSEVYMTISDYLASGDLTRDYSLSVGYGALAFYPAAAFEVGTGDQRKLLASARQTLDRYLATDGQQRVSVPSADRTPDIEQRTGVFVTVRKKGELRGCIGALSPSTPLWDTVADRTLASTTADPRFPALTRDEGPVTLEVSLLTPLKKVTDWRRFRLGQGAALIYGKHSGILLPQVAAEMNWSRQQFLEGLARKAGLPPGMYKDSRVKLYVYDAQVFGE